MPDKLMLFSTPTPTNGGFKTIMEVLNTRSVLSLPKNLLGRNPNTYKQQRTERDRRIGIEEKQQGDKRIEERERQRESKEQKGGENYY